MKRKTAVVVFEPRKHAAEQDNITTGAEQPRAELPCLIQKLAPRGDVEFYAAPFLVDLSPRGPAVQRLKSIRGHILAVAPLPSRAIHWLLVADGLDGRYVELPADDWSGTRDTSAGDIGQNRANRTVWCLDLREGGSLESCERCLNAIDAFDGAQSEAPHSSDEGQAMLPSRIEEETSRRWYPVVDRRRCKNCLECLNFCLFGVYDIDENQSLLVAQPDACRPGCPACSRVCPHGAIMFPDHADPAVAGDPRAAAAGPKADLYQFFGGNNTPAKSSHPPSKSREKDALDNLVDDLDELDL